MKEHEKKSKTKKPQKNKTETICLTKTRKIRNNTTKVVIKIFLKKTNKKKKKY